MGDGLIKSTKLWRHGAIALIAAGPVGGFLFGLLNAGDPDSNPVGRVFYAFIMAVVTPLHGGFPPHNEAGKIHSINAWPYIVSSSVLIFGLCVYRDWRASNKRNRTVA